MAGRTDTCPAFLCEWHSNSVQREWGHAKGYTAHAARCSSISSWAIYMLHDRKIYNSPTERPLVLKWGCAHSCLVISLLSDPGPRWNNQYLHSRLRFNTIVVQIFKFNLKSNSLFNIVALLGLLIFIVLVQLTLMAAVNILLYYLSLTYDQRRVNSKFLSVKISRIQVWVLG